MAEMPAKPPMRLYEVTSMVEPGRYYTVLVNARSRAAAKYAAWLERDHEERFPVFLQRCAPQARVKDRPPHNDGYDYIRKAYKVCPTIGQRCRIKDEGSLTGSEGTILYPGTSSAHVKISLDGVEHPVHVHPFSVVLLP